MRPVTLLRFSCVMGVLAFLAVMAGCASTEPAQAEAQAPEEITPLHGLPLPPDEENARLAWFRAENYVGPATAKDFDEAVRLFQQEEYKESAALFETIVAAGIEASKARPADLLANYRAKPERRPYRIVAGDSLSIQVVGWADLTRTVTVRTDGKFTYHYIGEVDAVGKTIPELTEDITKRLAQYIKDANVTVFGEDLKGNTATVIGAVAHPGPYPVADETRLWDFIAKAGGLTMTGSTEEGTSDLKLSYLLRNGDIVPVSFERLFKKGDATHNIIVYPEDLIFIAAVRPSATDIVTILGTVNKPGNIRYREGMKVTDAIADVGGVFIGSSDVTNVDIADYTHSYLARGNRMIPVDLRKLLVDGDMTQNVELKPGDIINIPNSRENRVYVLGEVGWPRDVTFGTELTFVQALAAAGGLTLSGQRGAVYYITGSLSDPKVRFVDALAILQGKQPDFRVGARDIIYVSPTRLTEVSHIISQILPGLTAVDSSLAVAESIRGFRHGY